MVLTFHLQTNKYNDCERAARAYYSLAAAHKTLLLRFIAIPLFWRQCRCGVLQGQQALQQIFAVVLGQKTNVKCGGAVVSKMADASTATTCEWRLSGMLGVDVHGDPRR
jgi:hypothetical protein